MLYEIFEDHRCSWKVVVKDLDLTYPGYLLYIGDEKLPSYIGEVECDILGICLVGDVFTDSDPMGFITIFHQYLG